MLADDILAAAKVVNPRTFLGDRLARLTPKIEQAERFQFDSAAFKAVENLIESKPSSVLEAARSFARPPYDVTWIEWPMGYPDINGRTHG